MSKITKKQFLADVEHEIRMLKEHATQEEVEKLDFQLFNPRRSDGCIYGQMTGECDTPRAKELMDKACIRVLDFGPGYDLEDCSSFIAIKENINGSYTGQDWYSGDNIERHMFYLSSLEGYICFKNAKKEHIIDFLKGKVETLKLS